MLALLSVVLLGLLGLCASRVSMFGAGTLNPKVQSPYGDKAPLDMLAQPLYSAVSLAAAVAMPREIKGFQYGIGGTVAGAGGIPASEIHTNLEGQGGQLPQPKLFVGTGIRVVFNELGGTLIAQANPALNSFTQAADITDLSFADILKLFYGTMIEAVCGERKFARGPCWLAPANTGLGGFAAAGVTGTPAANAVIASQAYTMHGVGRYWGFGDRTLILPPGQHFEVSLKAPQVTTPTIQFARLVYLVLDGKLGVEAG